MPQPTTRKLDDQNSRFSVSSPMKFSVDEATVQGGDATSKKRKFSGVAYSGDVIENHWYWGNVIFDMASMDVPSRLPALVDHNRSKRAGYVTDSKIDNATGFTVNGVLLSNEDGAAVAQDSDEGFPWQMSVHIEPRSIEEFAAGEQTVINGRTFTGPLTVFRNSTIVEVSFTATGQDSNTAAVAMSRGGVQQPSTTGDSTMTPEQIAAMQQENATLKASNATLTQERDAARTELDKFSKERRENDIKTLFSDMGREYKADDAEVKAFSDMPQAAFDVMAGMMRSQFKKPAAQGAGGAKPELFSHTATGGSNPAASNGGTATEENALLKDAEKRAAQFSKRMPA
jgi:hypothetical protein